MGTTSTAASTDDSVDVAVARQLGAPVLVMVTRDGCGWRAEVAALGVVRNSRSLHGLVRRVRALLGTDAIDYQFDTGDVELDQLVRQIRLAREAVQAHGERARKLTGEALRLPCGGSVRDLAVLIGLSHQRVHQLMRQICP